MPPLTLKSVAFRREREAAWRELEELVRKAQERGLEGLPAEDLYRLPVLYRGALSSLSVARAISLDQNLVAYLETLAARAHVVVYGVRRDYLSALLRFFAARLPGLVWGLRYALALAILLLVLGTLAGCTLTVRDPDLFYSLVPEGLADGRGPLASREELLAVLRSEHGRGGDLSLFASSLLDHNAGIGLLCFTLGFAAGVPVMLLLFYNGLVHGAFAAIHWRRDLALEYWGWVLPHGVTELLAVCLCGAAGLAVGWRLVFPGRSTRLHELAHQGRESATVVVGAVALFALAALLEGFFRQRVVHDIPRLLVAGVSGGFWLWYFVHQGRRRAG